MKKKLLMLIVSALCIQFAYSQSDARRPIDLVRAAQQANTSFQSVEVFVPDQQTSREELEIERTVQDYDVFDLDLTTLQKMMATQADAIALNIPLNFTNSVVLELVRVDILTPDFSVIQRSDNAVVDVTPGVHYRGIIRGDEQSIAAVSFFENEIMGLMSSDGGNLVIGRLNSRGANGKHIIYDDFNVITDLGLECGTADDGIGYKKKDLEFDYPHAESKAVGDCIRLYMEVDNDIHNDKGGVSNAANFTTGLLNQVITLYANENIQSLVSQIVVWDVSSPYSSTSSSGMLSDFQANTGSFNGDLGQLLSYQASGGIAAGFSGICNSNSDNSLSFSSINSTYSTVPAYSWSVMVVTHEFGHLWGSRHTHACVWNGNNTAIDGCSGSTEGSCSLPGYPSQGGTLMSYCHLQSVGINFNEGFGPQPGNVIRNSVNNASCTAPCGPPTCTDGYQNGNETGVDCGGPDCPACPTCTDGIQNGNETGVDCGGPDCAPCPCFDNGVTLTIVLDNYPEETSWDIRDGGTVLASGGTYGSQPDGSTVVELACLVDGCYDFTIYDSYGDGICCSYGSGSYLLTDDSDGSTLASGGAFNSSQTVNFCVSLGGGPSCTDGIQNGSETGIDCGGPDCPPCPPVPTCTDGIQNGDETGVDCGGPDCPPCPPVPTCTDGIQNGDETGVDCGGSDCPPCGGGDCTYELINFNNFNSNWGIWNDGGSDCRRSSNDAAYAVGGTGRPVRLRDNTSSSVMTTDNLNLSAYEELTVDFSYYARSMDNSNEDFWLQISTNGGSSYTTVEEWNTNDEFVNNTRYYDAVVLPGPFTSNTRLRFRCDASNNSDWVYIDDVEISGCLNAALVGTAGETAIEPATDNGKWIDNLTLFPNPARQQLMVNFQAAQEMEIDMIITDFSGKRIRQLSLQVQPGPVRKRINVADYAPGVYILHMLSPEGPQSQKFVVVR